MPKASFKFLPSKMGFCPLVIAMEEIDHISQKRKVTLYDVETGKLYEVNDLPYQVYSLSSLKGEKECWEKVFEALGLKWTCERREECSVLKRLAKS